MVEFILVAIGLGPKRVVSSFYHLFDAVVAVASLLSLIFLIVYTASGIDIGGNCKGFISFNFYVR